MSEPRPQVLDSHVVHRSRVFDVARQRVRFPDGREHEWTVVQHPGAVAIVALDAQERWLLIRQYRVPVGLVLLEIPAGTLEPNEPPEVTAHRELREETGFAAAALERLGGTWMAPGFCTEYMHYFLATGLREDPLPRDHDEQLSAPVALTFEQVLAAIDAGEIEDAKTVVAATLFARLRARRTGG